HVGVLDVEVRAELPSAERPSLVEAQIELVKRAGSRGVDIARVDRRIGARVVVHDAAEDGGVRRAGDVTEARAGLPTAAELVASERGQDVCLVVVVDVRCGVVGISALAARQRVRHPTEEATLGLVTEQELRAVDFTRADVLVRLAVRALVGGRYRNDQVVQILVEAFDRELERMADFLLETEAGVHRAWAADPRRAERRDALVRL